MRTVELKVLEKTLVEYVRFAARGETVLITDGGRVVARLVPPQAGAAEATSDPELAPLIRAGLVTPAAVPPGSAPRAPAATEELSDVLRGLEMDRSDR